MDRSQHQSHDDKLQSWKEIAAYFGRDERTVRRWEESLGLPVHRYPGKAKGRVYAYASELKAWEESPGKSLAEKLPSEADHRPMDLPPTTVPESLVISAGSEPPRAAYHGKLVAGSIALLALLTVGLWARWHHTPSTRPAASTGVISSTHVPTSETEDLYLQGRYYWNKRTPGALDQALNYFSQAILRDPNYAKAYAGVADTYLLLREFGSMSDSDAYARAYAAASKAIELDPSSFEAHASLGFIEFWDRRDLRASSAEFERALALNPNYVPALHWYGNILCWAGRDKPAQEYLARAQELDPGSSSIRSDRGLVLAVSGHRDEAVKLLQEVEQADPSFVSPHAYLGGIYLTEMNCPKFLEEFQTSARLAKDPAKMEMVRVAHQGFSTDGCRGMLHSILRLQQERYAEHRVSAYEIAVSEALLGDKAAALQQLRLSLAQNESSIVGIRESTFLQTLHSETEFRDLVVQAGLLPLQ